MDLSWERATFGTVGLVCPKRDCVSKTPASAHLNRVKLRDHKLHAKVQDRQAAALLQAPPPSKGRDKATSRVVLDWSDGVSRRTVAGQASS